MHLISLKKNIIIFLAPNFFWGFFGQKSLLSTFVQKRSVIETSKRKLKTPHQTASNKWPLMASKCTHPKLLTLILTKGLYSEPWEFMPNPVT